MSKSKFSGKAIKLKLLAALSVFFWVTPACFGAEVNQVKVALYNQKKFVALSATLATQTSAPSLSDHYLTFKSLAAQNKPILAQKALNRLQRVYQGSLLALVPLYEQINQRFKAKDTEGLLALLGTLPRSQYPPSLTRKLIIAIGKAGQKNHLNPNSRRHLERAFGRFQFAKESPTLLKLYLKLLPAQDTQVRWALLQLFQVADIARLPPKLKQRFAFIRQNPTQYSAEIKAHFLRQLRARNYSYIRSTAPFFLEPLKYADRGAFDSLRDSYFKTYFRSRRYSRGLKDLDNQMKMLPFDYLDIERWMIALRLNLRLGRLETAQMLVDQIANAQYPEELSQAQFWLGKAYFNQGEWVRAFEQLRLVNGNEFSEKNQISLQWDLLMVNLRIGHIINLQRILDWAAVKKFKSKSGAARFCYWGYKLGLYRKGTYLNCYQKYPNTYYGLRSKVVSHPYGAFDHAGTSLKFRFNRRKLKREEQHFLEVTSLLYDLHETKLADMLVEYETPKNIDLSFFEALRKLLARHQRFYLSYKMVQAHHGRLSRPDFYGPHYLMPLNYPLAFEASVKHYAKAAKIDPALVFAVMREESRYREYVKSGAGAIGLLQLMPKTARFVGRLHRKRIRKHQLVQPKVNLQLGSWYLSRLSKKFDGNLSHVLAAYNGGARHVKRWIKSVKEGDQDYFVELITFPETRHYVKRVMKSYYQYQNIYGPM